MMTYFENTKEPENLKELHTIVQFTQVHTPNDNDYMKIEHVYCKPCSSSLLEYIFPIQ